MWVSIKACPAVSKENKRLTDIFSRGGSVIFAWMEITGLENPFYEHYDWILDICQKYDVTLSLGDACRPGCIADAGDVSQIEELVTWASQPTGLGKECTGHYRGAGAHAFKSD